MATADKGAAVLDAAIAKKPQLSSPKDHGQQVRQLWKAGMPSGEKTGWPMLDHHYTVVPGQFTILTGWPSSGKSEWLDALLVNLMGKGWRFAIYSFENQPVSLHVTKLMEKLSGKPFGEGPNERISQDEINEYEDEIDQHFRFADNEQEVFSVNDCLEASEKWLLQHNGPRGLVIDPWNELDHWRPQGLSETEYISKTLTNIRRWARRNKVHVWMVAHPQKVRVEGKLPIPKPDMISGSQHWWNKADCAITVYRDFEKLDSQDVDIYVQKVRFKHVGRQGVVTLKYDRISGRYHEPIGASILPMSRKARASGEQPI
jgi:twinkle protein